MSARLKTFLGWDAVAKASLVAAFVAFQSDLANGAHFSMVL